MRDVEVCVQPQLAEPSADPLDALEQLLAQERGDLDEPRLLLVERARRRIGLRGLRLPRVRVLGRARLVPGARQDRGEVPRELPRPGRPSGAAHLPGDREQPSHALAPLGDLLGGQQRGRAPGRAEPLDQPRQEHVGGSASSSALAAAVQLHEALDPLARLRRHLRRLRGGGEADDEVELAPPRDLDHAREVDLAQPDRGARERPHDGGGVLRIDEQPQPGEHVPDLGPLHQRPAAPLLAGSPPG